MWVMANWNDEWIGSLTKTPLSACRVTVMSPSFGMPRRGRRSKFEVSVGY